MKSANVWTSMLQLVRAMTPFELGAFGSIRQMYKYASSTGFAKISKWWRDIHDARICLRSGIRLLLPKGPLLADA